MNSLKAGGAERVLTILANDWITKYEVTIIQNKDFGLFYPVNKKIKIHTLSTSNKEQKVDNVLNTVLKLSRLIKTINADIYISLIHKLNFKSIVASKLARKKIIVCEHNNYHTLHKKYHFLRKKLYQLANHTVVLTKYDLSYYQEFLKKNVSSISNPLTFPVLKSKVVRKNRILCVGKIGKQKSFNYIVEAVEQIKDKMNGWSVHIVGDGPDKTVIQNLIKRKDLSSIIYLEGQQQDMLSWYHSAKVFVLCSQYEGYPMVLIEAMSQGLACISFDIISGPNEIINNRIDGVLVPKNNIDKLSQEMLALINNEKERERLSTKAMSSISRLHVSQVNKKWEQIFEII